MNEKKTNKKVEKRFLNGFFVIKFLFIKKCGMIINLLFQESQCTHGVCIDKAGMEAMRSAYCAYDGSQC